MGFELAGMPPAKKHISKLDLPCTLAISTLEGLSDLAGRVHDCELSLGKIIRHEKYFLSW